MAPGPRREVALVGPDGGRVTARPANAGRLMRFVSPTKPDTYGPVSISPRRRDTREPELTLPTNRADRRA